MDVIYSKHCACCQPAEFASVPNLHWRELEVCWEQAIRLGVVRPPALVDHDELIAQGPAALRRLNEMAGSS